MRVVMMIRRAISRELSNRLFAGLSFNFLQDRRPKSARVASPSHRTAVSNVVRKVGLKPILPPSENMQAIHNLVLIK